MYGDIKKYEFINILKEKESKEDVSTGEQYAVYPMELKEFSCRHSNMCRKSRSQQCSDKYFSFEKAAW